MKRIVFGVLFIVVVLISTGCSNRGGNNVEVTFTEIDLSEQRGWYNRGEDARGDVDLSRFEGQAIESRRMAERIGNEILAQHQAQGLSRERVLVNIAHDPIQNIWIFGYGSHPPIPGDGLAAAVDGNTSALLRIWVD